MADVVVSVSGVENLVRTLKECGQDLERMETAGAKAGAVIEKAARARVPRRSGALAASIRTTDTGMEATAPYAGPIHWGWPTRNIAANQFATSAARATEPQWIKYYEDEVQKTVDKVRGE